MSDVKIIVASHGNLSRELIQSAEMIAGPMENVDSLSLLPSMEPEKFKEEVTSCISKETPTIALVDLFGGTPANVISELIENFDIDVITGVNLSMLLEVYFNVKQHQFNSYEELVNHTVETAAKGIVHVNKILFEKEGDDGLD